MDGVELIMQTLADFAKRLAALEAIVNNLEQVGIVTAVHADENLLDIEVRGVVLAKVPYMTMRAGATGKSYWVPEVGESGIVFCPGGNVGNAIFLAGLNTEANPRPQSDPEKFQMVFGEGIEINIDTAETEIKRGDNTVKIDASEIEAKHAAKVKSVVGVNQTELTTILANIIGAHFFQSGLTNLICSVGPITFAPAPSPATAPSPPSGSSPGADGKVKKLPKSTVRGVKIVATSSMTLVLPAIPVTTTGGGGNTTPGSYNVTVTGTINLEFPARNL